MPRRSTLLLVTVVPALRPSFTRVRPKGRARQHPGPDFLGRKCPHKAATRRKILDAVSHGRICFGDSTAKYNESLNLKIVFFY